MCGEPCYLYHGLNILAIAVTPDIFTICRDSKPSKLSWLSAMTVSIIICMSVSAVITISTITKVFSTVITVSTVLAVKTISTSYHDCLNHHDYFNRHDCLNPSQPSQLSCCLGCHYYLYAYRYILYM